MDKICFQGSSANLEHHEYMLPSCSAKKGTSISSTFSSPTCQVFIFLLVPQITQTITNTWFLMYVSSCQSTLQLTPTIQSLPSTLAHQSPARHTGCSSISNSWRSSSPAENVDWTRRFLIFWAPGYIDWFRGNKLHQTWCFFSEKKTPSCSRHIVQVGCQVLLQQTVHNSLEHGDEKGIALKTQRKRQRAEDKSKKSSNYI